MLGFPRILRSLVALLLVGLLASTVMETNTPISPRTAWGGTEAPVPSGRPPRWELRFKLNQDLRLIQIEDRFYWFLTYIVTNRTKQDQIFVPSVVLYSDAGDIIRAGEGVPFGATRELLKLIANPLLESNTQIIGPIKQGREYAREGLVVWKAGSLDIDEVSIFFAGLSSETQVVRDPVTGKNVVVRKTLHRLYKVPGDPTVRLHHPVVFDKQSWIMR